MESLTGKPLNQIGIIVRDLEDARVKWAELLGCDVPSVIETEAHERTGAEYRGRPTDARCRLVIFPLGQVTIELIQPLGEASAWAEHLAKHGEGVHHLAFGVDSIQEKRFILEERGSPLVQHGRFPGGGYAYFEGREKYGVDIELLEQESETLK